MANKLIHKTNSTQYKVPAASDLDLGQIGINTFDGTVFVKRNDGADKMVDVVGPVHNGFHADGLGREQSSLSFNAGTRTFTIAPKVGYTFFQVYYQNAVFKKTGPESVVIPDVEGMVHIYYNSSGTLVTSPTLPAFRDMCYVANIYWNATDKVAVVFGDERHSAGIDEDLHTYLHRTFGTRYDTGLAISGYTLSTETDAACSFGLSNGTIWDEDLRHNIVASASPANDFEQILADPAQMPIMYRSGANGDWRATTANTFAYRTAGTGRLAFNQFTGGVWTQTEATSTNYVTYFVMATNDIRHPIFMLQGQTQDTSLANAQTNATFSALQLGSMPFQEFKILYRIILRTSNAFGGTQKCRIEFVEDLRASQVGGSSAVGGADHGSLSGLTDPDHPSSSIYTNTAGFNGILSVADTTVQAALDTIDNYIPQPRITSPAYGATMSVNADSYDIIRVALTGNVSTFDLTGGVDGRKYIVEFTQDATGSRTVSFGSSIRFGTDITSATLSTTANKVDRLGLVYHSSSGKFDAVAFARGY